LPQVMRRHLEDHIRELCSKAVSAPDNELGPIIKELQAALHEHNERIKRLAAQKLGPDKLNQRSR
jgi:hypothetical protein